VSVTDKQRGIMKIVEKIYRVAGKDFNYYFFPDTLYSIFNSL